MTRPSSRFIKALGLLLMTSAVLLVSLDCGGGGSAPTDVPAPTGGDGTPEPVVGHVLCDLTPIADRNYSGSTRPSVMYSWTGAAVSISGVHLPLDSSVVLINGHRLAVSAASLSGSGTITPSLSRDGTNNLQLHCHSGPTSATASATFAITPPSSLSGSLSITTETTGFQLDPDGYTVSLGDDVQRHLPTNGTTLYSDLPPGDYSITLTDIANNCTLAGPHPVTIPITSGQRTSLTLQIACSPTVGTLIIVVHTQGTPLDADGYLLTIDDSAAKRVSVTDSISLAGLSEGEHTITLSDVVAYCSVVGEAQRVVNIDLSDPTLVVFNVTCSTPLGSLLVETATTGDDIDLDGYLLELITDQRRVPLGTNDSSLIDSLAIGDYALALQDVSHNCDVSDGATRTVAIMPNDTTHVLFSLHCTRQASISGRIIRENDGAGLEDVQLILSQGDSALDTARSAADGTYAFTGVLAGSYSVTPMRTSLSPYATFTTPPTLAVTVSAGAQVTDQDFGIQLPEARLRIRPEITTLLVGDTATLTFELDTGVIPGTVAGVDVLLRWSELLVSPVAVTGLAHWVFSDVTYPRPGELNLRAVASEEETSGPFPLLALSLVATHAGLAEISLSARSIAIDQQGTLVSLDFIAYLREGLAALDIR